MTTFRCVRTSSAEYGLEVVRDDARDRVVNIGPFCMVHLDPGDTYCFGDDENLLQTVPVHDGVLCIFKRYS
mgnify:CR=1 FL=1